MPGRFGNAFSLSGSSSSLYRSNASALEAAPHVTVMAWVKSTDPGAFKYIVAKGSDGCNGSSWALRTEANKRAEFYIWKGVGNVVESPAADFSTVWDGNWHAIAGSFDGGTVRLYVDGSEVGSGTPTTDFIDYGIAHDFAIGDYPGSGPGCDSFRYTGAVDEVRVYDRALTATEIHGLQTSSCSAPPTLQGCPPPLHTVFNVSDTTPKVRQLLTFNAGQSTSPSKIIRYAWDLNGDGKPDVDCRAGQTRLLTRFLTGGAHHVILTTTNALGASSKYSLTLTASGKTGVRAAAGGAIPAAYCEGASSATDVGLCSDQPLVAGIVEAVGCFKLYKSFSDLPEAELRVLAPYYLKDLHEHFTYQQILDALHPARAGPRVSAALANNAKTRIAAALLLSQDAIWVSKGSVDINGLTYTPQHGARIVVIAGAVLSNHHSYVVSSNAQVSLGDIPLQNPGNRPVIRQIVDEGAAQQSFTFSLDHLVPLLPKMPLTGQVTATFEHWNSRITGYVRLPLDFLDGNNDPVTTKVQFLTDNTHGLELDGLDVDVPKLGVWGISVEMHLHYTKPNRLLAGSLKLDFPSNEVGGSISFVNGSFNSASLFWSAVPPNPGIEVGPGLFLTHVDGGFGLNPTEVNAGATVAVGPSATSGGCGVADVNGQVLLHLAPDPWRLRIDGQGRILCLDAGATSYAEVNGNGEVGFGGGFKADIDPLFLIQAQVSAKLAITDRPHFQFEGNADAYLFDKAIHFGGHGLVSDKGAAFCATVLDFLGVHVEAGVGFDWPPPEAFLNPLATVAFILTHADLMAPSCDVGPWRTIASAAQAGNHSVDVGQGEDALVLAVDGNGDAPKVTLKGPNGEQVVAPDSGALKTDSQFAVRTPTQSTTYFMVAKPAAGTWTVVEHPGSASVTGVRRAEILPDPSVQASVGAAFAAARKRPSNRVITLHYKVRKIVGQVVTFAEEGSLGAHIIGTAKGGKGTIRFKPSQRLGKHRKIVAYVVQNGHPRKNIVLRSFTYTPPKLGKPKHLKLKRHGHSLVVTWDRVTGADHYNVTVILSSGRQVSRSLRARKLSVSGVATNLTATALVSGQFAHQPHGKIARAKLKPKHRRH